MKSCRIIYRPVAVQLVTPVTPGSFVFAPDLYRCGALVKPLVSLAPFGGAL